MMIGIFLLVIYTKNTNKKKPKNAEFFICNNCDVKYSKVYEYKHQILTCKNKILINANIFMPKMPKNSSHDYSCVKNYNFVSIFCYYKKKCKNNNKEFVNNVCMIIIK